MSYSAIVAFKQNSKSTYDVYHSQNGADNRQLKPYLEQWVDGTLTIEELKQLDIDAVDGVEEVGQQNTKYTAQTTDITSAIDSEPVATNIPLSGVGLVTNFADEELLYVASGDGVKTYAPLWLQPNVIQPWRDHIEVEVYKSSNFSTPSPAKMMEQMEKSEPLRVIGHEELSTGEYLSNTITERVVREQHEDIYALLWKSVNQLGNQEFPDESTDIDVQSDDFSYTANLMTDKYVLTVEFTDVDELAGWLPRMTGNGIFVSTENRTPRELELKVAEMRFEAGGRLNTLRRGLTKEDLLELHSEVVINAYNAFGDWIADFTHPPYDDLFEAFDQAPSEVTTESSDAISDRISLDHIPERYKN